MPSEEQRAAKGERVHGYDVVRGLSVASMVAFHFCYDLKYLNGIQLSWFASPLQDIWRCSISWTFLFVAGCMCAYSRSNLRRAGVYLAFALGIFVATTVVAVDTPISFGIIYCMGACTLIEWLLERLGISPRGYVAALCLFACFILSQGIARGYVGLGNLRIFLPDSLYETGFLAFLGFPGGGFASGDYYPLLPYLFMYLTGTACSRKWAQSGTPEAIGRISCRPLEFLGRHALLIYAAHQPVLLLLLSELMA